MVTFILIYCFAVQGLADYINLIIIILIGVISYSIPLFLTERNFIIEMKDLLLNRQSKTDIGFENNISDNNSVQEVNAKKL